MNKYELINTIWHLPLNKKIDINFKHLKSIRFYTQLIDSKQQYSWACDTAPHHGMYVFPMRSRNYVKLFKTLKGAKRNFINRYLKLEPKNGVEKAVQRMQKC